MENSSSRNQPSGDRADALATGLEAVPSAAMRPFVFCALVKKQANASTQTQGARGGIFWAADAANVKAALLEGYLNDGWSVEILEATEVDAVTIKRMAALSDVAR